MLKRTSCLRTEKEKVSNRELMNVTEASEYLGISRVSLNRYVRQGLIPCKQIGRKRLYSKSMLDKWVMGDPH